jgi:predicted Zn-dependent protease
MEYRPSLPEHNDNVSHEHPLKEFMILMGGLLAVALLSFWCLGLVVDMVVDKISPQTEAAFNKSFSFSMPATRPDDAPQQAQLQALVSSMEQCAGVVTPSTVHLLNSKQANAAVFAGGNMVVFSGLLGSVESANGLSFVLAHELGHLAQRDHLRAMGRAIVLMTISGLLTGNNSDITQVLAPVSQLGEASYSRERELAADTRAVHILQCRYGHVGGATEFFTALKNQDENSSGVSHYIASHPGMQQRIDALNKVIAASGYPSQAVLPLQIKIPKS